MRILVTGGSGVVGTGTVTELVARGHSVVLLSRHADSDVRQWAHGVTPRNGDVTNAASIAGAADGCDAVLHMVAVVEESGDITFQDVNVKGTANVLAESARARVGRFVFVSSLGAATGESAYHASKRTAEWLVKRFDGSWTICRPGNVYGPGDEQVSMMLRMVRGPSPIVPTLGSGDQPFQPVWWEDCAKALAAAAERVDLAGRELDIAGPEVTSQNDVLKRLGAITGRHVNTIPVPDILAQLGAKAASAIGWDMPLSSDQATMVNEGNVITAGGANALDAVLGVTPTRLDAGLRQLADMQPEQLPGEGIGTLKRKRYWARIVSCNRSAESLFTIFRNSFNEVTPAFVEAGAEPGSADVLREGESVTLSLPIRGHVQVRVAELSETSTTLLTVQGHPLAGAVRFTCAEEGEAATFAVDVYDRAASMIDLLAMRTIGDRLQSHTWETVVERMVERSGGSAPGGVQHELRDLDDAEARAVETWLDEVTMRLKRRETSEKIGV